MLEDRATADGPVKITEEIRLFIHNLFALAPKTELGPPYDPPAGFVWVPPGEFILGGSDGFKMQITRLDEGFFLGKYPVTNAEYARFVAETWHNNPPFHWKGQVQQSEIADHPVVDVDWHDALSYCSWLRAVTGKPIALPSEAQWEKAARGVDGRVYPWGDAWDAARCNTREATTPVGAYSPTGDGPYGAGDQAGNVWEWMASERDFGRLMRGGACSRDGARCAFRGRSYPLDGFMHEGFRVCFSPSRV
jgi:formylglycine-generating enzyme required for sulfatase activity